MAQTSTNLSVTKFGYVRNDSPSAVVPFVDGDKTYSRRWKDRTITEFIFAGFSGLSSSLKNRRLYSIQAVFRGKSSSGTSSSDDIGLEAALSDFNPSTLVWSNMPDLYTDYYMSGHATYLLDNITFSQVGDSLTAAQKSLFTRQVLQYNAVALFCSTYPTSGNKNYRTVWIDKKLADGVSAPYFTVSYDDSVYVQSQIFPYNSPIDGYVNPRNAVDFAWTIDRASTETYYCLGGFTQASASLKWKASGGSWNTVSASGSTQSLTVPANTFTAGTTIEWYITGTDNCGQTCESAHYTFSTAAGTATATALAPLNTVEDGSKQIVFRWTISSTDGQPASRTRVWWKLPTEDNNSWHVLLDVNEARTSCTAAANTFSAGEIQWKVQAFNVDGTAGPWDANIPNPKRFICIAAPGKPTGLQATSVPRTTITWQSSGQEAYEIEVDGVSIVKEFGPSVNSYKINEPLSDGPHTIRVRIQGVYGLWSNWASTTISITNVPPWDITLSGEFGVDAQLFVTLNSGSMPDKVLQWYRDGKRIAWTTGTFSFTDRFALGQHEYYVEAWHYNGNYSRTNIVTGVMKSCETRIALAEYGSEWMTLNLSENSDSVQGFSWSQASSLRHVRGDAFPVLEMGESEDLTASYDCAFKDLQEAKQLEAFKGKIVVIKSRGGNVQIGALTNLSKRMKDFYITYSFSVQRIHWEDFVRYDEND